MTTAQFGPAIPKLRLWPGILAVTLQWLARFVLPAVVPDAMLYGVIGGILGGGLAVLVWWLFFSRAPWAERMEALILMPVVMFATSYLVDESIRGGAMGMMYYMFAIPVVCLALVLWAVVSRRLGSGPRRLALVASIFLACGMFTLLRTGGISGEGTSDLHWRWTPTPEERLLAQAASEPASTPPAGTAAKTGGSLAEWPGFRGQGRDGVVRGVQIATDWALSPPTLLWRRAVGPGWSSFAVGGDLIYTQEQRGEDEVVSCYSLTTGQPVWMHKDPARFWESNAGAGPRGTPTLKDGRVYACGATGIVSALDAAKGAIAWSRNLGTDAGAKVPGWGFASSPLVVDDMVIVAAAGKLVAYDIATGKPLWVGPSGGGGYSSPHLATLGGVKQVLLLRPTGALSVAPATGKELWKYAWRSDGIVQPALTPDGDVLIGTGSGFGADAGMGVRRIAVAHGPGGWTTQERWTSAGLKPQFNDFVVHQGHAFGFDGSVLACIDLKDGKRKWRGDRYGHGQVIVLPDQDLLLVLSEQGELALVGATPGKFTELGRVPAIEGKTWNHPVLVGDIVLVRNDQEMAAFRLSVTGR